MRIFLILFLAINLHSHSLKIFTKKDNEFLHVKAYFSASSPCIDCNITALRFDKKEPFTCKSDQNGNAKIPLNINPIKIIVNADLGHKNSLTLKPNLANQNSNLPIPFWAKILIALVSIFSFFAGLRLVKKR